MDFCIYDDDRIAPGLRESLTGEEPPKRFHRKEVSETPGFPLFVRDGKVLVDIIYPDNWTIEDITKYHEKFVMPVED